MQTLPRPWLRHGLRRGTVVVARFPGVAGLGPDPAPETVGVKRIVALPGEYVRMAADGGILVNDVPLPEPYLPGGRPASGEHFPAWLCDDGRILPAGRQPRAAGERRQPSLRPGARREHHRPGAVPVAPAPAEPPFPAPFRRSAGGAGRRGKVARHGHAQTRRWGTAAPTGGCGRPAPRCGATGRCGVPAARCSGS